MGKFDWAGRDRRSRRAWASVVVSTVAVMLWVAAFTARGDELWLSRWFAAGVSVGAPLAGAAIAVWAVRSRGGAVGTVVAAGALVYAAALLCIALFGML